MSQATQKVKCKMCGEIIQGDTINPVGFKCLDHIMQHQFEVVE